MRSTTIQWLLSLAALESTPTIAKLPSLWYEVRSHDFLQTSVHRSSLRHTVLWGGCYSGTLSSLEERNASAALKACLLRALAAKLKQSKNTCSHVYPLTFPPHTELWNVGHLHSWSNEQASWTMTRHFRKRGRKVPQDAALGATVTKGQAWKQLVVETLLCFLNCTSPFASH